MRGKGSGVLRRSVATAFAVGLVATTMSSVASADEQWCETDPVFIVDNAPIRVTAGLDIDPAQVATASFELHVASGSSVLVVADTSARLPESTTVVSDLASGVAPQLIVTVVTVDTTLSTSVSVGVYGPTALQPDVYTTATNARYAITLPTQ